MVSIIVCSAKELRFEALCKNVEQTIGVDHEFIRIDNQQNQYGICAAYNKGIKKGKGSVFCFLHEDILFHTNNWGCILFDILRDSTVGLIGVAGSSCYALPPIGWFNTNTSEINILQHFNQTTNEARMLTSTRFPAKERVEGVVVDGVFMAIPAQLFPDFFFNEALLNDFHGYDIDMSLQIGTQYRVVITKEILLEHFSEGKKDAQWYRAMKNISKHWKNELPRFTSDYSIAEKKEINIGSLDVFFRNKIKSPMPFWKRTSMTLRYGVRQGIFWDAIKILLRYYLKKETRLC